MQVQEIEKRRFTPQSLPKSLQREKRSWCYAQPAGHLEDDQSRDVQNLPVPKRIVMADVDNLRATINSQLLKAEAAQETPLFTPVTAQAVTHPCPSRGLQYLSFKKTRVTYLRGTTYPEYGQRNGLELFSLPLGGAEALFVQTPPFVTSLSQRKIVNRAVHRSIWRAHYTDDLILLEGEVSECISWGLGVLQQNAVVWT